MGSGRCENGVVDPVSLIVAALAAGAVAGAQNTATDVVKDAYAGLKALARRRLAGRQTAEAALERPAETRQTLTAELAAAGAADDTQLVAAADRLLSMVDPDGTRAGRYLVDLRGSQGVQVGDHGVQTNTFGTPPPR
jgi:hypothetical protein